MSSSLLSFKENENLTIGIELELQLVNLQTFNLAREAEDFLRRLSLLSFPGEIKPEITQAMLEINSSVHPSYPSLLKELKMLRHLIADEAYQTHIGICGGGTHPFQKWKEQQIFETERFKNTSEQYGYLAQQFTVFGQHIHIACKNGDEALYLCHALAAYVPHFIALSAASPFNQGVDTAFDCSRLAVISAFPLSGTPPWLLAWDEFTTYFENMQQLGVVKSMKDFYWDLRPKPEFGTVELRICDTPLTIEKAAELAAFAQLLAAWLLDKRVSLSSDVYLTYLFNRFRASRYGLEAVIVDPLKKVSLSLARDLMRICHQLDAYADSFEAEEALMQIREAALRRDNGAKLLRTYYTQLHTLNDTVRKQVELWTNRK